MPAKAEGFCSTGSSNRPACGNNDQFRKKALRESTTA